jgi:hypothetical protein
MRYCASVCLLVWQEKYRLCVCHIYVIIATHILPKAGWNLVFRSCSRLGVEVNSPRCTAQNSTTTIKFDTCSTLLTLLLPNELAQVMTALNSLQKILLSEFLLRHWLIILQTNVSVRDLACTDCDQAGSAVCPLPNTPCTLYADCPHRTPIIASKASGHYMYHQFNIHQSYVLPTQCIYVFCVDLGTNAIISLYSIN